MWRLVVSPSKEVDISLICCLATNFVNSFEEMSTHILQAMRMRFMTMLTTIIAQLVSLLPQHFDPGNGLMT